MKKTVRVTQLVEVEIDESKFTPEFMAEFRKYFYQFETLDKHIEHLGQLCARGLYDSFSSFIEGYGPPAEMGIKLRELGNETEVEIES